jgi:hypothetical protein
MSLRMSPAIECASPTGTKAQVIHGAKETTLALILPRGLHYKFVSIELSAMGRDQLLTALLDWRYVVDEMPDEETRVMLAIDSPDTDEPVLGCCSEGHWWNDEGGRIAYVYAWAHIPGLPPKKEGKR